MYNVYPNPYIEKHDRKHAFVAIRNILFMEVDTVLYDCATVYTPSSNFFLTSPFAYIQ